MQVGVVECGYVVGIYVFVYMVVEQGGEFGFVWGQYVGQFEQVDVGWGVGWGYVEYGGGIGFVGNCQCCFDGFYW